MGVKKYIKESLVGCMTFSSVSYAKKGAGTLSFSLPKLNRPLIQLVFGTKTIDSALKFRSDFNIDYKKDNNR
ncbi:hypothetical protein GCM10009597_44440 [Peribacillus frigoritolerans]